MSEMAEFEGYLEERLGQEVMVWTAGGHYFRGILRELNEEGFILLQDVSCTLAGERGEREMVVVALDAVDAVS